MEAVAVGFWGAYFGAVALMLTGSVVAFARSLFGVALAAALSALSFAAFVVAYLGWLPVHDAGIEARLLAHIAVFSAAVLGLMLMTMLGLMRQPGATLRIRLRMLGVGLCVILAGWWLEPAAALVLSSLMACGVAAVALVLSLRGARRGDRLAWVAVCGVAFMLIAVFGLSWIALHRNGVPWPIHAISAVAGMACLATMATTLWTRYSYLIELREVMAHGPSYDPVTRMRSHVETGQMVGALFFKHKGQARAVGVIAVSIGNLYALEKLHGRAAANHALFVCASRLRRCAPVGVEMGRYGEDGFLLLVRDGGDAQRMNDLARQVRAHLSRPVALSTSNEPAQLETGGTQWVADAGVGVLLATTDAPPSTAVTTARAMARTASSYASHIACWDSALEQVVELSQVPMP